MLVVTIEIRSFVEFITASPRHNCQSEVSTHVVHVIENAKPDKYESFSE